LQSVGPEQPGVEIADIAAGDGASQKLILPRFLRKPVRALLRKDWKLPRAAGLKGMAALFLATAMTGMFAGGHTMTVVAAVTSWCGLAIENVRITGQSETSEVDVLGQLGLGDYPSLVSFDVEAARARIEAMPWVKEARIKKLYPDTLQIAVVERTPYAIWQHDSVVSLIDKDGKVIIDDVGERYARLPFVVGEGAEKRVAEYVDLIAGVPDLQSRIHAGVLISNRRWNVVLNGGVELLLPEKDPGAALVAVAALDTDNRLLSRDIAAVDLRASDKLIVRLTESGAKARKAMLDEREKLAKKGATKT
jgi:cell division protein FtsQ